MSNRGITLDVSTQLVTEECFSCHVLFAIPSTLRAELIRVKRARTFYCPNGHGQAYVGEAEETRLKRELEATTLRLEKEAELAARRLQRARDDIKRLANDNMDLAKSNRALKGAKTRLLRRVTNGVCPCCSRSFADLKAHMTSQHPGEVVGPQS